MSTAQFATSSYNVNFVVRHGAQFPTLLLTCARREKAEVILDECRHTLVSAQSEIPKLQQHPHSPHFNVTFGWTPPGSERTSQRLRRSSERRYLIRQNRVPTCVTNVLQRCGSGKLHEQLERLTNIVEELGGRTRYTDDRENAATPDEVEEDDHVA